MPLFLNGGEGEISLTMSPHFGPLVEEFVIVFLKPLAGQETNVPPCPNDVSPLHAISLVLQHL